MRVMVPLAAVLAAFAVVLSGCGGDEQQPQTQQVRQLRAQVEQQQEQPAARPQPAESERASQSQREVQQTVDEPPPEDTEAQVERAAQFDDPLLDEAYAAFSEWSEGLESIVLDVETDFNLAGLAAQMSATVSANFEPLTILTTLDATQLFTMFGDREAEETAGADELFLMAILMTEDAVYLTMPDAEGWIDLSSEAEGMLEGLTGMLGGNPAQLADPDQLGLAFGCVDAVGGSTTVGSQNGEAAWIIDCEIDVDALNEAAATALAAQGIEVVNAGIQAMLVRLAISQESGAPLLIETNMTLRDAFGFADDEQSMQSEQSEQSGSPLYINTVTYLRSWNEAIEFPSPEPLFEGSLMDAFASAADDEVGSEASNGWEPPELLNPEQLIDLSRAWTLATDELERRFVTQAVIDGEVRLASTMIRRSRSRGAFETTVHIDDGDAKRLLWNQDGIWASDFEENGRPIWAPSNPALLGFAGLTLDEFLDELDNQEFDVLRQLTSLAWVTRTIEGNAPPIYELVFESGYRLPGEDHFDLIADLLRIDTAELLAENVSIDEIGHFSLTITLQGDDGELISQVTTAEFVTNAGRVELQASLTFASDGPFAFSTPNN